MLRLMGDSLRGPGALSLLIRRHSLSLLLTLLDTLANPSAIVGSRRPAQRSTDDARLLPLATSVLHNVAKLPGGAAHLITELGLLAWAAGVLGGCMTPLLQGAHKGGASMLALARPLVQLLESVDAVLTGMHPQEGPFSEEAAKGRGPASARAQGPILARVLMTLLQGLHVQRIPSGKPQVGKRQPGPSLALQGWGKLALASTAASTLAALGDLMGGLDMDLCMVRDVMTLVEAEVGQQGARRRDSDKPKGQGEGEQAPGNSARLAVLRLALHADKASVTVGGDEGSARQVLLWVCSTVARECLTKDTHATHSPDGQGDDKAKAGKGQHDKGLALCAAAGAWVVRLLHARPQVLTTGKENGDDAWSAEGKDGKEESAWWWALLAVFTRLSDAAESMSDAEAEDWEGCWLAWLEVLETSLALTQHQEVASYVQQLRTSASAQPREALRRLIYVTRHVVLRCIMKAVHSTPETTEAASLISELKHLTQPSSWLDRNSGSVDIQPIKKRASNSHAGGGEKRKKKRST